MLFIQDLTEIRYLIHQGALSLPRRRFLFRGAHISSLPTNACSTENEILFPHLANHIVPSKFWKVDLDCRVT